MRNLNGKIALVTGAASGIGRATANAFAQNGADLVLVDINEKGLAESLDRVKSLGRRGWTYVCNVADKAAMENLAKNVAEDTGGIDVLMNCAGIGVIGDFTKVTIEDWEKIIGINLWGTIYGIHYFLPGLIKRGGGHIVNISSALGLAGTTQFALYCTTKFAVLGMAESLRADLAKFNIGVTAVCPGIINTAIQHNSTMYAGTEKELQLQTNTVSFYDKHGWPPEKVAKAIIKSVKKNRFLCLVTPETWILYLTKRFAPGLIWRMGAFLQRKLAG